MYVPGQSSPPNMAHLAEIAQDLIDSSLSDATKRTYNTALGKLTEFKDSYHLPSEWPVPCNELLNFIAFLSYQNLSPTTITTYISGIAFKHKLLQVGDTTKSFLVVKALEGLRRKRGGCQPDIRAPITLAMLQQLMLSLSSITANQYEQILFQSAFSLAFFGLLRVGEFAEANNQTTSKKVLKIHDLAILDSRIKLLVRYSKTDQYGKSVTLDIPANALPSCPVLSMQTYLASRPQSENDSLFIHLNSKSLTKYQFKAMLQKAVSFCQVGKHVRPHSFRIGGATYLASLGTEEQKIMIMGRWKSSAYSKYIRF